MLPAYKEKEDIEDFFLEPKAKIQGMSWKNGKYGLPAYSTSLSIAISPPP